jgi:hypothetical protein
VNPAVQAYYLQSRDVIVDRSVGIGEGLEATSACRNGCIIVDDTRKPTGARPNPSQRLRDGPYVIRIVGTRSQANQRRDQPKRSKAKRPHAYPASFTSARAW